LYFRIFNFSETFLKSERNILEIHEGTEAGSFLRLLEYIANLNLHPEAIVYIVEDDYLHRPGWIPVLLEGFKISNVDYVTLYDHKDKYFLYPELKSHVFATRSCHWRTTPSTTNTFATRYKTLMRDLLVHQQFSKGRSVTADHQKYCQLHSQGAILISCLPAWSTHAEPMFASPCIQWEQYFNFRRKNVPKNIFQKFFSFRF